MTTVKLDHHKLLLLITFNCSFSCSVTPLGISRHLFSYQQQRMEVLWRNKAFALKVKWRHRVDILSPGFCSQLAWPGKSVRPLFKKTSKLKLREKKRFKTKRRRQPGVLIFFIKMASGCSTVVEHTPPEQTSWGCGFESCRMLVFLSSLSFQ